MEVNTNSTIEPETMYDYINSFFMNLSFFIIIGLVVIGYIVIFFSLGKSGNENSNTGVANVSSGGFTGSNILMSIVSAVFLILFVTNILQYFFGINVMATIKHAFTSEPEVDIVVDETNPISEEDNLKDSSNEDSGKDASGKDATGEITVAKQVFNIPKNVHDYEDAKTICAAYGARLANYDEVEDAYNNGGEWCNYGWSEGQMALFPTQKGTFDDLQKKKGHENDCGRPGVNGGYMSNPLLKFGVNCYGYKPNMTEEEQELMEATSPTPKTEKDLLFEKRVSYWKSRLNEIIVSPFNYNSWSKI